MSEAIRYETCFICGEKTGRAGRYDDSIYDEQGRGPYCESCHKEVQEKLTAPSGLALAEAVLEEQIQGTPLTPGERKGK